MSIDSKLFDAIRIKKGSKAKAAAKPASTTCQWDGCEKPATHKAPLGRDREGQYINLCIDHVREYNKSYNYFSGLGDVLAGAVVIPSGSAFREVFLDFMRKESGDDLWWSDAVALEENSRDFKERVEKINANGMAVFEYLDAHPKVKRVYYPISEARKAYDALKRPGGGYGGLLSMDLVGGEAEAQAFYDALRVCKGPSLGTDFTLACPYTLLAHYEELVWAQSCGVGRNLVRVSVGLEDFADLKQRFDAAFAAMPD